MKINRIYLTMMFLAVVTAAPAQHIDRTVSSSLSSQQIFGLFEIPFLLIALVFSFLTATQLKGGKFGSGMKLLAWGFVVMAIGHLHMQLNHLFNFNLFYELLGNTIGNYVWFIALFITWALSALGFYKIYKASKV